ncbi:MAG: hypothetical protein ACKVOL_01990, partial [Novosphingobium sp.]
ALGDHAGQRRAGLLCMPNGGMKVRDFVSSNFAFKSIVDQALQDMKPKAAVLVADGTTLTISLKGIKAKLCARSWGAFGKGDRVSLTGTATVTFDWSVVRPSREHHATAEVTLDVAHADAAAPEEILRQTVNRLLEAILASASAA